MKTLDQVGRATFLCVMKAAYSSEDLKGIMDDEIFSLVCSTLDMDDEDEIGYIFFRMNIDNCR